MCLLCGFAFVKENMSHVAATSDMSTYIHCIGPSNVLKFQGQN